MRLKDIISKLDESGELKAPYDIEFRITLPADLKEESGYGNAFCGYCKWDGETLIPYDGDDYSLEDEIYGYEVFDLSEEFVSLKGEKGLCVIINWDDLEKDLEEEPLSEPTDSGSGRTRAERRKNDYRKALRKRDIARKIYTASDDNWEYYDNIHQY